MKRALFPTILGFVAGLSFLGLYIATAVAGTDGEGSFLYGDKSYLVFALLLLLVGVYGIYALDIERKGQQEDPKVFSLLLVSEGLIGTFFFLGAAIKLGLKGKYDPMALAEDIVFVLFFVALLGLSIYRLIKDLSKGRSTTR